MTDSYDCIVVGDDCAALSAAALLAGAGFKTLLLTGCEHSAPSSASLLPCCRHVLERLQLISPLADSLTATGQTLRLIDAQGNFSLTVDGGFSSKARLWRPEGGRLPELLMQAAKRFGVDVVSVGSAIKVYRQRANEWRVQVSDGRSSLRHATASLVVDTRFDHDGEGKRTEIRGVYRNVAVADPNAAAVATRALDGRGWCSLTPLAGGLTSVRIVCHEPRQPFTDEESAQFWEDRLVQVPKLLERLASAELVSELRASTTEAGVCDPWGALGDTCDLLLGEEIADRTRDIIQAGIGNSLAAPLGRRDATGAARVIRAALNTLFGASALWVSNAGCRAEAVRVLNKALGNNREIPSPFPPSGDEAILTRA